MTAPSGVFSKFDSDRTFPRPLRWAAASASRNRRIGIRVSEPLVRAAMHVRWLLRERCGPAGLAAEALPDFVGASERPIPRALALARVGEAIAMATEKIAAGAVQLGNPPPTRAA